MLCQSSPSTIIVSGKDTAKGNWSASGHLHTRNTESSFVSPPDPCTCSTLQDHHQHRFYKPLAKAGQVSTTLLLCPPSSPSTGTTHHPGRKIVLCCCTCPLPGRSPPGPPARPLEHSIPMHTCRRNSANPCLVLASTTITITGKEVTGHLPIPIGQVNRRVVYQSGGCCSKVPRSDQMRSDQSR